MKKTPKCVIQGNWLKYLCWKYKYKCIGKVTVKYLVHICSEKVALFIKKKE